MADSFNDGKPQTFNAVIRDVATSENIPLMDVRSVLHDYDNRGTGPDGYHLSVRDTEVTSFARRRTDLRAHRCANCSRCKCSRRWRSDLAFWQGRSSAIAPAALRPIRLRIRSALDHSLYAAL